MAKPLVIINKDIKRDLTLRSSNIYVIDAEVHVAKGIKLTAEDQATILISNGVKPKSKIRRSALIFDQGSILKAKRLIIKAASEEYKPIKHADNGGIWFMGNFQDAAKDGLSVKVNRKNPFSSFNASTITTHYLGRHDSYTSKKSGKNLNIGDDIDGISILGVGRDEWEVKGIRSLYSADDGLDVTNSHVRFDRIEIINPTEDGLNLSSSRVEVHKSLIVDVSKNDKADREIFDFEVDDGSSFFEIYRYCAIDIKGCFGDEVVLSSIDLPKKNNHPAARYKFKGVSKKRSSLVYSIRMD